MYLAAGAITGRVKRGENSAAELYVGVMHCAGRKGTAGNLNSQNLLFCNKHFSKIRDEIRLLRTSDLSTRKSSFPAAFNRVEKRSPYLFIIISFSDKECELFPLKSLVTDSSFYLCVNGIFQWKTVIRNCSVTGIYFILSAPATLLHCRNVMCAVIKRTVCSSERQV
jgi:hypothetical protein